MEVAGSTEHGDVHREGLHSDSVPRTSWTKTTLNRKQQDRARVLKQASESSPALTVLRQKSL